MRRAEKSDGPAHELKIGQHQRIGAVAIRMSEHNLILFNTLLLDVDGNRQVHRPAPAAECQTHGARNKLRDSSNTIDHERALGDRRGHMDLIDLLLRAAPQVMGVGAAGDGNHRAFSVHGVGEAGNRVGKPRSGVHAYAGLLGDPAPRIRHVHRRLLMARVVDLEILIRHHVEHRQDMIAGQGEYISYAFELERFTDQMTPRDSRHDRLLFRRIRICQVEAFTRQ